MAQTPGCVPGGHFEPKNYLEMSVLRYALKRYIRDVHNQRSRNEVDDPALLPDMQAMLTRMEVAMYGERVSKLDSSDMKGG